MRFAALLLPLSVAASGAPRPGVFGWLQSLLPQPQPQPWQPWTGSAMDEVYEYAVDDTPSQVRSISDNERAKAEAEHVNLLYGFVPVDGIKQVFAEKLLNGSGHRGQMLADMGHGAGQVSLWAFLNFQLQQVVGVEYSRTRWNISCGVLKRTAEKAAQLKAAFPSTSAIHFIHGDFSAVAVPLSQYPMVFMETDLPTQLLEKMRDVIGDQAAPGSRVLTFSNVFPAATSPDFKEIMDEEGVHTTWSKAHRFHYWEKLATNKTAPKNKALNNQWLSTVPQDNICSLVGGKFFPAIGTIEEKEEKEEQQLQQDMQATIGQAELELRSATTATNNSRVEAQAALARHQNNTQQLDKNIDALENSISAQEKAAEQSAERTHAEFHKKIAEVERKAEQKEAELEKQFDKRKAELELEIKHEEGVLYNSTKQNDQQLRKQTAAIEKKLEQAEKATKLIKENAEKEADEALKKKQNKMIQALVQ